MGVTSMKRYEIEADDDWRGWITKIPFIPVKPGWQFQPIPPFGGAVARFRVKLPDGREKSIYFDAYERIGYFGQPYWEVYPCLGDVGRCALADVDKLLEMIEAPDEEQRDGDGKP